MIKFEADSSPIMDRIKRLKKKRYKIRPILSKLGVIMEEGIRTNFEVGGRPSWRPLSKTTVRRRKESPKQEKRGRGRPSKFSSRNVMGIRPLIDTGRLYDSIDSKVYPNRVEAGSYGVSYAKIQNYGGKNSEGRYVPARPFLHVTNKEEREMEELITDYLSDKTNKLKG